jgi:hypothetical protein
MESGIRAIFIPIPTRMTRWVVKIFPIKFKYLEMKMKLLDDILYVPPDGHCTICSDVDVDQITFQF